MQTELLKCFIEVQGKHSAFRLSMLQQKKLKHSGQTQTQGANPMKSSSKSALQSAQSAQVPSSSSPPPLPAPAPAPAPPASASQSKMTQLETQTTQPVDDKVPQKPAPLSSDNTVEGMADGPAASAFFE
eukprot:CAMPEP_0182440992 /NCGR_PEP_ID=MMETSP1167-20130531/87424_1 /TAXON_ID=2988 /ORGANISM="Mallomonas Sp, Strain CCMP3275" /LENGTH=128 /DNA_ID=CAMNT_0024635113 /DNA_START=1389 /DNA_END=1775 /DNA_ORIENTATION=+